MTERRMLTAEDWIQAGFRALSSDGAQAIRAERLARTMKVSKGSFYWHFADVPALQTAMLWHWQQVATHQIIAQLEASDADFATRLFRLAGFATSAVSDPYGGFSTEAAIRDWARHDPAAAAALQTVDTCRLTYLNSLFAGAGLSGAALGQAVRLFHCVLVGAQHLPASKPANVLADLEFIITQFARATPM